MIYNLHSTDDNSVTYTVCQSVNTEHTTLRQLMRAIHNMERFFDQPKSTSFHIYYGVEGGKLRIVTKAPHDRRYEADTKSMTVTPKP